MLFSRSKLKISFIIICLVLLFYYWLMLKATGLFAVEPTSSYSFKIVKSIETVELNEQVEPIEQVEAIEQDSEEVEKDLHRFDEPELLNCQLYSEKRPFVKSTKTAKYMTPHVCQLFCLKNNSTFMGLTRGDTCICANQNGAGYVQKDSDCKLPCSGNAAKHCGGIDTISMYRIDTVDGNSTWSTWMRVPLGADNFVRTRYRKCSRLVDEPTSCSAELDKDFINAGDGKLNPKIKNNVIGCFTSYSFAMTDETPPKYVKLTIPASSGDSCLKECSSTSSKYAVFVEGQCYCTTSLGWAQPADTCVYQFGATVYSVKPISDNSVTLVFEKRRTKLKVGVVAYFRGGSTLASSLFYLHQGSLSVYEMDKLLGSKWPNVAVMGAENERSELFLSKIYPAWFYCDSTALPGIFYRMYPKSGGKFNTGLESLEACQHKVKITEVGSLCAVYVKEKCLMSPIVSAKTVRILHAGTLAQAAKLYSDIQFIYVLRDPRAMQASRASMIKWYGEDQVSRLRDLCWEIKELHGVFGTSGNTHVVHYEDMATDIIASATQLYKETNVTLTGEILEKLKQLTGEGAVRKSNFDIIQKDPKSRIGSWVHNKKMFDRIKTADSSDECAQVFRYYSSYYKPLTKILSS
ncbi:WSCD1 [Bugula neritina]|uniref:WSCD1 n=1 Tax=Bugula neritina TaxID=10212 RepID=A0A7J7IUD7_BUGNE|nr:WSCD1 [Bugula neritina]